MSEREPGLYELTSRLINTRSIFDWRGASWYDLNGKRAWPGQEHEYTIRGPLVVAPAPCKSLARLLDENYSGVLSEGQRKQVVEWAGQVREPAPEAVEEAKIRAWNEFRDFLSDFLGTKTSGKQDSTICDKAAEIFSRLSASPPAACPECEKLSIGDLVEAVPPFALACGSGIYSDAVVVSVEPLVLVSREGDMRWSVTVTPEKLEAVGRAPCEAFHKAMRRYMTDIAITVCPECGSNDDTMLAWLKSAKERAMSDNRCSDAALLRDVECRLKTLLASRPAPPSPEVVHGGEGVTLREGVWLAYENDKSVDSFLVRSIPCRTHTGRVYVRLDIPPAPEPPKSVMPSGPAPVRIVAQKNGQAFYGDIFPSIVRLYSETGAIAFHFTSREAAERDGWQIEVIPESLPAGKEESRGS